MIKRRAFLGGTLTAMSAGTLRAPSATAQAVIPAPAEPLVWPVVTKVPAGIRSFAGHTDTVPDIVGRIGTPASLVIFTEGNHLMALLSDDILGAFPSWAKSQPRYADLDLDNIVVVTVPQPAVVQMIRVGGLALGNLVLDVSRKSGFYPDIVMAGPGPLRQLRQLGAIEPQARFFSRNRGFALLVRKGNPLGIHALADVARSGGRIALPEAASEPQARARYRAAVESALCIAIFPRWWRAATPTWPSPSITSFPIGRGYSQTISRWYPFRVPSGFL
jgi:hypothetical protein